MKLASILLVPALAAAALACNGDDDAPSPTSTIASQATAAPTESPGGPTATSAPQVSPTAPATLPPTDGTVFPQNPGSTDAFPMKPLPDPAQGIYVLTDIRVGAHPESGGWDRIVFEFEGQPGFPGAHPGGIVEYVESAAQCGSGMPVDPEGEATLHVRFDVTQAHDDNGQRTIDADEIQGPGNAIIESLQTCDFEGVVEWTIGVDGEQNFKVVFLEGPARIVIDVKWP